jgi:hypothetical protein
MKVLVLGYETERDFARRSDKADYDAYMKPWFDYGNALTEAGVFEGGHALQTPDTSTSISIDGDKRRVQDGPFIDSKEQVGGFFILNVADMDEATKWAAKCPAAATGRVEVRVVPDYGQEG